MARTPLISRVIRAELLIAAEAAERWPVGRHPYASFHTDEAEQEYGCPCRIPVAVARREGCPAVAIAAARVVRAGRTRVGVTWREVWEAQARLVDVVYAAGIKEYLKTLSAEPLVLACLWRDLADLAGEDDDDD